MTITGAGDVPAAARAAAGRAQQCPGTADAGGGILLLRGMHQCSPKNEVYRVLVLCMLCASGKQLLEQLITS